MGWLTREISKVTDASQKKNFPTGVWEKCPSCNGVTLMSALEKNLMVCTECEYHYRINAQERIELLIDESTFIEWDHDIASTDPLEFNDGRSYQERLNQMAEKTKRYDSIITGAGLMSEIPVALGVLDFYWMGGSLGAVAGERIYRLFARATRNKMPVILCSSSGGARMHEGLVSLMQMAKTSAAIALHSEEKLPFISVLCDPTTGGVAASFAMLGDLNIAEPKAIIGFAGRRVIETIIRQKLPDDFQTAEFCMEHGVLDKIVKRSELKDFITHTLKILMNNF